MNKQMRYDDDKIYNSGRSRARGNHSRGRAGSSAGSSVRGGGASRSGPSSRNGAPSRNRASSGHGSSGYGARRGGSKKHKKSGGEFKTIAMGGVLLIAAVATIVFLSKGITGGISETESETETTMVPTTELQKEVTVDNIPITGMSRNEARDAILKNYPWDMKVTWQEEVYQVADLMGGKVDTLLDEVYLGEPKEHYTLDTSGLEEAAKAEAANVAAKWDKTPKNGAISSYDKDTDKFLFTGAEQGQAVNQDKLAQDITEALGRKEFDAVIVAVVDTVEPEVSEATAREKYKTISTCITKTTSNSKRNTNIKLAAQAINGTVLQPGEEFSFNKTVGQRTEAKGYKGAAAYNNGEVVEEIGGGVCQVSSTLYNAVLRAGLKTTKRQSHTYEPSYVDPGSDATVSWNGPDYKFVNNSDTAIGIRASYADQTMTVSIYGMPILEEGVTYSLKCSKIKDTGELPPVIEEDPTLQPGEEKVKSKGSQGSQWEARLVIKKDGEIISQEVDHTVTYKGHAPVILKNTSGTVAPTESLPDESTINPNEPLTIAPEGAGDGFTQPAESASSNAPTSSSASPQGPGGGQAPGGNAVGEAPGAGGAPTGPQTVPAGPVEPSPGDGSNNAFVAPIPIN